MKNTDIIATVAHDLQTPLTALKAQLCLMTRERQCTKEIRLCNELIDCMSAMIHDILAFARSRSTFSRAGRRVFSLSESINNVLEYVDVIARAYRIRLITNINPNITVRGNQERIEEALLNILSNSMKYLEKSGVRVIAVSLKNANNTCIIEVRDTGIGIPEEELPHIFTRFYRTTLATRHAAGSGLGLAISKNIIEAHKGTIDIESAVGKGTRVTIRLPITKTPPKGHGAKTKK